MTDRDAWEWVYSQRPRKTQEKLDQICFTGFAASAKQNLQEIARNAHLEVVTRVTKNLRYLCATGAAGPSKMREAKEKHVTIIDEKQFLAMIETGELPTD
jgi:DNA ligase (NAD+)